MTFDSAEMGKFEFIVLSSPRAAQLIKGCTPRVPASHKRTTTALHEVAGGKVIGIPRVPPAVPAL